MQKIINFFYAEGLDGEKVKKIKPLDYKEFEQISIGERFVLWHQFESLYNKIKTIDVNGKKYKIAYFLKNENYAEFYEHKEKFKILIDYFYSMLKAYINCADILVTNQQYAALVADNLNKPIFWIKDHYAKEQKSAGEILQICKNVVQLPINFDVIKNIEEFLKENPFEPHISEDEFIKSNPFPLADLI